MTTREKIKKEYGKVNGKVKCIQDLADKVGRSPLTLRNHWFAAFWSIPAEDQETVLDFLTNRVKNQQ